MGDLTCPLCGQGINTQQYAYTKKKLTEEVSQVNQNKIKILNDTIYEKERYIQELEYEHSQKLDRVLTNHSDQLQEIKNSKEEIIQELETRNKEMQDTNHNLTKKTIDLEIQLVKKQSELLNEEKEIDISQILKESFPDDNFALPSSPAEADILQTIYHHGKALDIRICYDNKQNITVTKTHVDKAKMYQNTYDTEYVLIVSSILPKTDIPNSLVGTKDGILLVHPKIIVEVSKLLREHLIAIYTRNSTEVNRDTKEGELYNFVTSHKFAMQLSVISNCYYKLDKLLNTEMTSHTRNWKQRKKVLDELLHAKINVEQEVIVITGEDLEEIKTSDELEIDPSL